MAYRTTWETQESNIPPSTFVNLEFTEGAVSTALQLEKVDQSRNILSTLLRAKDPESGAGLEFADLVINAQTLLYPSLGSF